MKLTDNFDLEEFAVSATHPELVEPVPVEYIPNVRRLCETILEPMRQVLGRPIIIDSGYRSEELNAAIPGSSSTSQHLLAQAADIRTANIRAVFRAMMLRPTPYPTGQVIYYPDRGFIHVALPGDRYPRPTFCLHWPRREYFYHQLADVREFDLVVPA